MSSMAPRLQRLPLAALAGLGVYLLIERAGYAITFGLAVMFSGSQGVPVLLIFPIQAIIGVIAAALGGICAGWIAKENGGRYGLIIVAIALLLALPILISQLSSWLSVNPHLSDAQSSFRAQQIMIIVGEPISWLLKLLAGWRGGVYGENLARIDQGLNGTEK